MTEDKFKELIWAGMGRAILYVRENDISAFRDIVLDACLHCYAVDAQSEGTRSAYMLELVEFTPDAQFYSDQVLAALPQGGDDWHAAQRLHFAAYMAFNGHERARQAIYENFAPGPKFGERSAIDFVRLDGLAGFLFAAAKLGELLIKQTEVVDEGRLWSSAKELCGDEESMATLRQAAETDPRLEAYRAAVTAHDTTLNLKMNSWDEIASLRYAQLRPKLHDLRPIWLDIWGERASKEDCECAAHGLINSQSPEEARLHLRMFFRRPFPLDCHPIVELSASENEEIAEAAAAALARITHPAVRERALQLIEGRLPGRQWVIGMVRENWEPGDHELVLHWFESETDRDVRHRLGMDLEECWKRYPAPTSEILMLHSVYESGTCSFCREFVVRRLIELDAFSPDMRRECAYDANDVIRELVGAGGE